MNNTELKKEIEKADSRSYLWKYSDKYILESDLKGRQSAQKEILEFIRINKDNKQTSIDTTLLFWQESMPIASHSLLIPELLFKTSSIRLKKSLENVSWNVCSALSRISFSFLSE